MLSKSKYGSVGIAGLILAALCLVACGGGGGTTPAGPNPPSNQPANIAGTWDVVGSVVEDNENIFGVGTVVELVWIVSQSGSSASFTDPESGYVFPATITGQQVYAHWEGKIPFGEYEVNYSQTINGTVAGNGLLMTGSESDSFDLDPGGTAVVKFVWTATKR